jgi:glycosyltransferase involved in cell wall biosynthesis
VSGFSVPVSVLILTKNEELDLPGCLNSVKFSDDVHVFDSESTDATREIATALGAKLTVRKFDNYATQRSVALQLPFLHTWVLVLDADERVPEALAREIAQTVQDVPDNVSAFTVRRRDFLWGTWLKHAQMSPFYVRLHRVGKTRYVRDVNEVVEVDGETRQLQEPFDHFPFSKGISYWIERHNRYATGEAKLLVERNYVQDVSWKKALFSKDFHERRVAQKAIFYCMPCRPAIKWLYLMFVRGGVLDGSAGITYSTLVFLYEYMIEVKRRELLRIRKGLSL